MEVDPAPQEQAAAPQEQAAAENAPLFQGPIDDRTVTMFFPSVSRKDRDTYSLKIEEIIRVNAEWIGAKDNLVDYFERKRVRTVEEENLLERLRALRTMEFVAPEPTNALRPGEKIVEKNNVLFRLPDQIMDYLRACVGVTELDNTLLRRIDVEQLFTWDALQPLIADHATMISCLDGVKLYRCYQLGMYLAQARGMFRRVPLDQRRNCRRFDDFINKAFGIKKTRCYDYIKFGKLVEKHNRFVRCHVPFDFFIDNFGDITNVLALNLDERRYWQRLDG